MRERLKPGCIAVAAWSVAALSCSGDPPPHGQGFGEPGDPIQLVVGYQPYYTEAWSAVVVRGLGLHERYLPRGSTGAVAAEPADALLRERGLRTPVGTIPASGVPAREAGT